MIRNKFASDDDVDPNLSDWKTQFRKVSSIEIWLFLDLQGLN